MGVLNVIGLGYIGLPTALMFAANGIDVVGTDLNIELIKELQNGNVTFKEDGLGELFKKAIEKNIKFTNKYYSTDRYIIAVPTPYINENKKIDVTYVKAAIKSVLEVCKVGTILIIESTIAPGTIDKYIRPLIESYGFVIGKDIHISHAPERIIPGKMIYELYNNSRTIGVDDVKIGEEVKKLYSSFCKGNIIITDVKTAEMSKVIENTYRDINIAFANELAQICEQENMDVYELIKIANMHPRVNILNPGPGVGGHCISVDPWFLVGDYPDITSLILAARNQNDYMPKYVFEKLKKIMKLNNVYDFDKVGVYGLTYKENVDDIRESPTLQFLNILNHYNIDNYKVYDPMLRYKVVDNQVMNLNEFLNDTEIVIILVGHDEIKQNQELLKEKIVYDTRNVINIGRIIYKL